MRPADDGADQRFAEDSQSHLSNAFHDGGFKMTSAPRLAVAKPRHSKIRMPFLSAALGQTQTEARVRA